MDRKNEEGSRPMVLKLRHQPKPVGGLVKYRLLGPALRFSDSEGLE